jgi:hypothetical protein
MEDGDTEQAKLSDVRQFADPHMHKVQHAGCRCGKNPMEYGHDDPSGLLAAEIMSGKQRDQCADKDRRDPISEALPIKMPLIQEFLLSRAVTAQRQATAPPASAQSRNSGLWERDRCVKRVYPARAIPLDKRR